MDGIINVNKPKDLTSFKTVDLIRRMLGIKKAGHAGTLDPSATGVLLVCLGRACAASSRLMEGEKTYEADITFGIKTDSGDADGKVLSKTRANVKKEDVEKAVKAFLGETQQVPPMVSALHFKGKRLYELARAGINVKREPRKITVSDIKVTGFSDVEFPKATILVRCSKGTYIRTLCEDIGAKLGLDAHESRLVRLRSGRFDISESKTVDEIGELYRAGRIGEIIINDF